MNWISLSTAAGGLALFLCRLVRQWEQAVAWLPPAQAGHFLEPAPTGGYHTE